MLDARAGRTPSAIATTSAVPLARAAWLTGRYVGPKSAVDLEGYEDHLYLTPLRGGSRAELRVPAGHDPQLSSDWITDDALSYGQPITEAEVDRLVIGGESYRRTGVTASNVVPVVRSKPPVASKDLAAYVGEYGWDHDILYIREKEGGLSALIEWFFEY